MTTNLWIEQYWYDYKLTWNPEEYGGKLLVTWDMLNHLKHQRREKFETFQQKRFEKRFCRRKELGGNLFKFDDVSLNWSEANNTIIILNRITGEF